MYKLLFPSVVLFLFTTGKSVAQKTKVEEVKQICTGLQRSEQPLVAVMPFGIGVQGADAAVGTGLPDMLMNALLNTGCFRVVERARLNDIMKEQNLGISGAGNESSFAGVGKLIGAQVLVFGTITEFNENVGGGGAGVGSLLRGKLRLAAGGLGLKKSHIGYTLRFVDPSTGELLASKSFDKQKTAVGAAGGGVFSTGIAGGGFYSSKSMQDAVEESLIDAVEYMSQNKSAYAGVTGSNNTAVTNNSGSSVTKANCTLLQATKKPKVMVIVPEEHLTSGGSNYDPARQSRIEIDINMIRRNNFDAYVAMPPTQASEIEISRKLLEAGFDLVDPKQFNKLKDDKALQDAFDNTSDASKVASRFGADIIIIGDAFSEYSRAQNNMSSCRGSVQVKAVMAGNATILAANSFSASGLDATEIIAGKKALAGAGAKIGDYVLTQLCAKSDDIISYMGKQENTGNNNSASETDLQFNNVDYTTSATLTDVIKAIKGVSNVEKISYTNKVAKYKVTHTGDTDALIGSIVKNRMSVKLDVLSVEDNFANIDVK